MNWLQKQARALFGCPPCPKCPGERVLEYCYYGLSLTDPPQITGHVTMAHIGSWYDWNNFPGMLDYCVEYGNAAKAAGITRLMFTLDFCLFTPGNPKHSLHRDTQVQKLIKFADRIRDENLLDNIAAFYVIDEPNIPENNLSAQDVTLATYAIRDVFSHYVLTMPKLAIIYGWNNGAFPGIAQLDMAGFDNYGAPIFSNGMYNHLKNQLTSKQKSIIVPGGSNPWRENPDPFYAFAQANQEVGMIMPFMWFDNPPSVRNGIVSNGMAPAYTAVGNSVVAEIEA